MADSNSVLKFPESLKKTYGYITIRKYGGTHDKIKSVLLILL